MTSIRSICVYCGSSDGRGETYLQAGRELGRSLASNDLRLVYGGGTKGIMGAVALGTSEAGGRILGIIPRFLVGKETSGPVQIPNLELVLTDDMHVRKHTMFEESDAFVALPGGIGTLEEVIEIMTWAQLGRHSKPIVFANIGGFWDPVLALLDHMKQEGFLHSLQRVRPLVVEQADEIVPAILEAAAAEMPEEGDRQVIERL
ncbi:MAG: LOG family protein [Rhizobiaceae bacterium]